uniref:Uncharacterized protein n=1 Tax=Arundo donax TaxID=35708 RepID=A0A0A9EEL4_ARUDO
MLLKSSQATSSSCRLSFGKLFSTSESEESMDTSTKIFGKNINLLIQYFIP